MAGCPDLAHEGEIERRLQSLSHLKRHRHAATRKGQNDRVLRHIDHQARDELAPGMGTIPETQILRLHGFSLPNAGARRTGRTRKPLPDRVIPAPGTMTSPRSSSGYAWPLEGS